ncbi:ABC transporter substrate-binding protein [Methanoculleus sp. DTU007]|jgi:iron complex transport system substrate-binding protein|uniref:ABC transporter substrate-binding protein n=1 Tax=Methanoculleus sp. DTU007 TaxID=1671626 RepID=UPI000ACD1480|nr:ABC transporter substrate-binding protein [Methanoculleus sp. DTU007]
MGRVPTTIAETFDASLKCIGEDPMDVVVITKHCRLLIIMLGVCVVLLCASAACTATLNADPSTENRTITDMAGRTVVVPSEIKNILCTSPPSTMLVYMVAPDRLAGWNFAPEKGYIADNYMALPVIGGWFGKETGNYETFISMHPDVVIEGYTTDGGAALASVAERQQKLGSIPVVAVEDSTNSTGYSAPIRFMGDLLGEEKQAEAMIAFYEGVLATVTERVASIPEDQRVGVYYAEGPKGLTTDPSGSPHSELIDLCGGRNVADCAITPGMGMTEVSMEQVIAWNPDVILAGDPGFYATVRTDPLWQEIAAVKTGRVYLTPRTAFCWFDRPPGINRIVGIPWTAKVLYPDLFQDMDLESLVREYHEIFLHVSLSDDQIREILNP